MTQETPSAAWAPAPGARHRGSGLGHVLAAGICSGLSAGLLSALFLLLLAGATSFRQAHMAMVWGLPAAGWLLGAVCLRLGSRSLGHSSLVINTLFELGPKLPQRTSPLILFGTVTTHLFGGSAGREGAAVQMGACLADAWAHLFGATGSNRQDWLRAGVAAGFSAVFGTPWAAACFAHEFFGGRLITKRGVLSAGLAAFVGDSVSRALGARHTHYPRPAALPWDFALLGKWLLFSCAMAAATVVFIKGVQAIKGVGQRILPQLNLRMASGGAVVVALWQLGCADAGLGLGLDTISRAFADPHVSPYAFAQKMLLTAVTVGSGFLGGEVTPLFFVGATLGNTLAHPLDLPLSMAAAVGMSALFAAAAHAPLAVAVMAFELFGAAAVPHVLLVGVCTCMLMGHNRLYAGQRAHPLVALWAKAT